MQRELQKMVSLTGENNRVLFFWYLILQSIELGVFFKEGILGISLLKPSVVLMVGLLFIAIFFLMAGGSDGLRKSRADPARFSQIPMSNLTVYITLFYHVLLKMLRVFPMPLSLR